jgi:glycosyltransferase involved in cell wall biosynthesis
MSRALRILQVVPAIAPRYGGPSETVVKLSRALGRLGHDVMVATSDADGPGRLEVALGRESAYEGIPAVFFARRLGEGFKYTPAMRAWLKREIAGYDVVHVHAVFSHASLAAARACRRAGVPYVLRPLGTLDPWGLSRKPLQKRVLLLAAGRRMIAGAAAVHYTTEAERRLAEASVGSTRAAVIPLGIDDEWLVGEVPAAAAREPVVLSMGRLHPVKNLEALIGAFHEIARRGTTARPWRLAIAGDGEASYVATLKARAAEGAGRDRIEFTGWVPAHERLPRYDAASLLAQPSHQESFGIAVVEAMARGVPVVVSTGVNLAEEIRGAGAGWIARADAADLARALDEAIRDDGERARRGEAGRRLASRFAWSQVATAVAGLYEEVVAADRRLARSSSRQRPVSFAERAD